MVGREVGAPLGQATTRAAEFLQFGLVLLAARLTLLDLLTALLQVVLRRDRLVLPLLVLY